MAYGPEPGTNAAAKNERAQRELGLNLRQLAALLAATSSWLLDGCPGVSRLWVNKMVAEVGGYQHAGDELLTLCRRGMLIEVTRIENEAFYRPTPSTVDKVRGWMGMHERGQAAE